MSVVRALTRIDAADGSRYTVARRGTRVQILRQTGTGQPYTKYLLETGEALAIADALVDAAEAP